MPIDTETEKPRGAQLTKEDKTMSDANGVLGWDDTLENDGSEFVTLKEGDYVFEVTNLERGAFSGSEKMCGCPKATLTLKVETPEGTANVYDDLILHKKMEWKLSSFFRAIGAKQKGEKMQMKWNSVIGSKGKAHIVINKYTDRNGNERENNKVGRYLDYDESKMPKEENDGFMSVSESEAADMPFN